MGTTSHSLPAPSATSGRLNRRAYDEVEYASFPFREKNDSSSENGLVATRRNGVARDYNHINYKIMFVLCGRFFLHVTHLYTAHCETIARNLRNEKREIYDKKGRIASFLRDNSEKFTILPPKRDIYDFPVYFFLKSIFYSHYLPFPRLLFGLSRNRKARNLRFSNLQKREIYDFPYVCAL